LIPGYKCEKPIDAEIYIKVSSGYEILLQKRKKMKNLIFPRYGNNLKCEPSGYFYEESKNAISFNAMSFEVKQEYKNLTIEIYCKCENLKSMIVWLSDDSLSGSRKLRKYLEKIEKTADNV